MLKRTPEAVLNRHQILVISDLHFPRSDSHPKYVYEALLYNPSDTLIILGDLYEGYDKKLGKFNEWHMRVLDLIHHRMMHEGQQVIIIPGNHDKYLRTPEVMGKQIDGISYLPDIILNDQEGNRIYAFHGDQLDNAYRAANDDKLYTLGKKLFLVGVYTRSRMLIKQAKEICTKKGLPLREEFHRMAAQAAKDRECHAVLTGHNHDAVPFTPVEGMDVRSGNTGCAVSKRVTFMCLTRSGEWKLTDWLQERSGYGLKETWKKDAPHPFEACRPETLKHLALQKILHRYHKAKTLDCIPEGIGATRKAEDMLASIRAESTEQLAQATRAITKALKVRDIRQVRFSSSRSGVPILSTGQGINAPAHCTLA